MFSTFHYSREKTINFKLTHTEGGLSCEVRDVMCIAHRLYSLKAFDINSICISSICFDLIKIVDWRELLRGETYSRRLKHDFQLQRLLFLKSRAIKVFKKANIYFINFKRKWEIYLSNIYLKIYQLTEQNQAFM